MLRRAATTVGAASLLLASGGLGVAHADNLQDVLVAGSNTTFTAGGSSALSYYFVANGSDGCNVDGSHPATVAINAPSGLTATPSSLTFTSCQAGSNKNAQSVTFTSTTPGTYTVTPSITGGKAGNNDWNSTTTTFTVNAPADSTPPVITPSVSGTAGSNGWYTSDVTVSWTVTDAQSTVTSTSGCGSTTLTSETAGTTLTCTATSAGGTTSGSVTIKLDKTGPSAALSPSGTAGANGWFTGNVTVSTSGTDTISGAVTCTADQALTSETTGQTVTGSCTNAAGLTTNAAPITVKIDKTAPTGVTSAVTAGTAGTGGWYTTDVTVTTTGTEDISGPVSCTGPVPVTGTTSGTTVNGSCTNEAGLSASAEPLTVKIDQSKPSATLSAAGTLGDGGWYTGDVTVSTSGADSDSGVVSCTADQHLTTDTTSAGQDFNGSCINGAGLTQDAVPLNVKRDASPPSAQLVVTNSPTAGTHGWYTSDVVVQAQGVDDQSGVTCFGGGSTSTDTAGITFNGYCVNGAGVRTDAAPLTVKVDKTGPTAALAVTAGQLGDNDWYTSNVTVGTSGTDSVSSPVTCTADQSQTTETTGQAFNGSCTNDAGLTTPATPLTVKLDKTGPTGVASAVTIGTGGTNGWYVSDVVVSTIGSEDISGPASCTPAQTLQDETAGTEAAGSCTNEAGLVTPAPSLTVKIDKSAPSAALAVTAGTAGANGWYTSDVTVSTSGIDSISSPVTCTADQFQTTETTGQAFNGSCTNDAGLSANAASLTVKLDKTLPDVSVTPSGTLGNNGWYVSAVTLTTTGVDSVSAPVTGCTADQTQSADTTGATFTGSCTNDAGLVGTGAATIKVDRTAPVTPAFVGGPASGGYYFPTTVPAAPTCTSSDATSGLIALDGGCTVTGYSTAVGSHTLTATAADLAGNTSTATLTYNVYTLTLNGFFQPVDMNGIVNTVKGGSTVPLKFRVFDQGVERTDTAVVKTFGAKTYTCGTAAPEDAVEMTTTGGTSLRYDTTGTQFIQNWQTPKAAGSCYVATVTFVDGSKVSAYFKLK